MVALLVCQACVSGAGAAHAHTRLDDAQMERLLAPVALFDDRLLLDALDASRHPVQVSQARRQLRAASSGTLVVRDKAPAVRELLRLPRLLDMLADHPAWARQLALAFTQQEADLLRSVQRLRWRALRAGALGGLRHRVVHIHDTMIEIETPGCMALPVYEAWCVYGPWASMREDSFAYEPPPASCDSPSRREVMLVAEVSAPMPVWGGIDWQEYAVWVDPQVWRGMAPDEAPPSWWRSRAHRPGHGAQAAP